MPGLMATVNLDNRTFDPLLSLKKVYPTRYSFLVDDFDLLTGYFNNHNNISFIQKGNDAI